MQNIHSRNLVGISSWWPEIWQHELLISPVEIRVNWPSSLLFRARPIYTAFNGANEVFMQLYRKATMNRFM